MEVISGKLVIANTTYGRDSRRDELSHGLAIYLPARGYNVKYDSLAWARDTKWDDFLKEMKSVNAPGMGCVDPGPGASFAQLKVYMNCLAGSGK
jgi:hypothetical protein